MHLFAITDQEMSLSPTREVQLERLSGTELFADDVGFFDGEAVVADAAEVVAESFHLNKMKYQLIEGKYQYNISYA